MQLLGLGLTRAPGPGTGNRRQVLWRSGDAQAGHGILYQITLAGIYTTAYTLTPTTGQNPFASLFENTNGILYSDTAQAAPRVCVAAAEWLTA